ncbi:hypothetical protein RA307_08160 [Xanthobacteraceae bacterium Astr-EGSB]|uniref:hypothetical protein n=1 Tax=Astrobacterium formosum TaxID=3069710 RepID=UPI0027B710D2|nr:hypothetical protein [Xanthobacteraceae bacterium Astr-EGSB]
MAKLVDLVIAVAVVAGPALAAAPALAEPLVSQGIGTSNCGRLAADLKPGEGLGNPINLMLYSWAQGYVSAANAALLEADGKHVDMSVFDDGKIIDMVLTFCKANPDKKPVAALDEFVRDAAKLKTKWDRGTIEWDRGP